MRIVLQKALEARCIRDGAIVSEIKNGYVIFVGFQKEDTMEQVRWMVKKILTIKLYNDWGASVVEKEHEIMLLSQFTLFAEFKGNVPGFNKAMSTEKAKALFTQAADLLGKEYKKDKVKTGAFGCKTEIEMINDGPFTAIIDK